MRILLLSSFILFTQVLSAQVTVAGDWTKTDCNGDEHQLYSELDSGFAILMEVVMLDGCMPCITAAHKMEPFIAQYNALYDNRVRWYSFGYNDSYDCAELNTWQYENAIATNDLFTIGTDLVDYYGGMGMPSIIVCGRTSHTVYYNHFGYIDADSTDLKLAIEYALGVSEPVGLDDMLANSFSVFPNPAGDMLQIVSTDPAEHATIYNTAGQAVSRIDFPGNTIDISQLAEGIYTLQVTSGTSTMARQFVKQ